MLLTSRATLACRSVGAKSVLVALAVAVGERAVPSSREPTASNRIASTAAPARFTPRRASGTGDDGGGPCSTGWYT